MTDQHQGAPQADGLSRCASSQQAVSPVPASIPSADDAYWDYEDNNDCWQCGGDGFVYGCAWDWQCDTWDGDSCLCTRPCDFCNPPKEDPALRAILAQAIEARRAETRSGSVHESAVPNGDAPETPSSQDQDHG